MLYINFDILWSWHPLNYGTNPTNFPCRLPNSIRSYPNECAIKMSIALSAAGVNISKFPGGKCKKAGHSNHVLLAESLANWLKSPGMLGEPTYAMKNGRYYHYGQERLWGAIGIGVNPKFEWAKGKRGIVFFKDFYPRDENRLDIVEGDHIDLFNGEIMTGANYTGETIIAEPLDEERFNPQE